MEYDNPNLYTVKTEVLMDGTTVDTYETDYGFRYFDFNNNTGFSLNGQKMKLQEYVCIMIRARLVRLQNDRLYRASGRDIENDGM